MVVAVSHLGTLYPHCDIIVCVGRGTYNLYTV
jgi:hypothetical protein